MKRLLCRAFYSLFLLTTAATVFGQPANVSGDWEITLKTPPGPLKVRATFRQEGKNLSGALKAEGGELQLQGTVSGEKVRFSSSLRVAGSDQTLAISLSGNVAGDAMKGDFDLGGVANSSWTAKRITSAPVVTANQSQPGPQANLQTEQHGGAAEQKPEDIEATIRKAMADAMVSKDKAKAIVVQDKEDKYWAFHLSKVTEITGNNLILKKGATFTLGKPEVEWTPEEIAGTLTDALSGMGGYFVSSRKDKDGKEKVFAGVGGRATKNIDIAIKKIISPAQ